MYMYMQTADMTADRCRYQITRNKGHCAPEHTLIPASAYGDGVKI